MRPLKPRPYDVITTSDLARQEVDDGQIQRLRRCRHLVRLHQGVYAVVGPPTIFAGAIAAAGGGSMLVLRSALQHLELRPWEPGPVHVNVPSASGREKRDGIEIHRRRIADGDVVVHRGLLTTTATRTLADVRREPAYALLRALEQAARLRMPIDRTRLDGRAHLRRPLELFDHYGVCTQSDVEAMFLFLCEDRGIARPLVNEPFAGLHPDFRWPQHRLIVEIDGYEFHHGRRAFAVDRSRATRFRRAGYEVVRFSAEQVTLHPGEVAETVLEARPAIRR